MADNVAITAGAGTSIATDDAGAGGHVQIVKLALSADASATPITADADGLLVNLGANNDVTVSGVIAHDGVDSGNPIKVGGRAAALAASVTLVAAADRADVVTDLDGAQIVRTDCQLGDLITGVLTNTDGAATAFTGNFAATASLRHYITCVSIANTSATAVTVDLRDGTGGAVLFTFMVPAGGGIVVPFSPPLRQPTVNTALAIDGSAAATTITVSVNGFKSKA